MVRIALVNQKGGVGKTTCAVNLASALVERGKRVLLVDMDPQGSATSWLGVQSSGKPLLDSLVEGKGFGDIVERGTGDVDVVPAGVSLAALDRVAAGEPGSETLLRMAFDSLPSEWDFIVVDSPPALGLGSINALVAVSWALVPVSAHVLSLEPLARLVHTMRQARQRLNPKLGLLGLVPTRVAPTNHHSQVIQLLKERFGANVTNSSIRENIRLAECPGFQKPITLYDPHSNGAVDYRALAEEIEERIERKESSREEKNTLAGV